MKLSLPSAVTRSARNSTPEAWPLSPGTASMQIESHRDIVITMGNHWISQPVILFQASSRWTMTFVKCVSPKKGKDAGGNERTAPWTFVNCCCTWLLMLLPLWTLLLLLWLPPGQQPFVVLSKWLGKSGEVVSFEPLSDFGHIQKGLCCSFCLAKLVVMATFLCANLNDEIYSNSSVMPTTLSLLKRATQSIRIFAVFATNTWQNFLCRQTKYLIKQKSAAAGWINISAFFCYPTRSKRNHTEKQNERETGLR